MTAITERRPLDAPSRGRTLTERVAGAPTSLLFAPLLVLAGVAVLAWVYALLPASPADHLLYWAGLGLAYAGIGILGTAGNPRATRQLTALAVLGAVTWLPYLLRSPDRLVFVDELFHRDVLARILAGGHASGLAVTMFPLPGTFPGLEDATVALMGLTGLPMDAAIRLMTLGIHVTIPALAYLAARGVGIGRRGGFLAGLVYCANTSFPFFHSVFSYESLGILLFLATWAMVALYRGAPGQGRGLVPDRRRLLLILGALPLLAGIAVTHHVSSYLLAVSLVVAWVAARFVRARSTKGIRDLAMLSIAFAAAWLVVSIDRVGPYLYEGVAARVGSIVNTLLVEHSQPRPLFANADQPSLERMLAFSYPPLILVLSLVGLWIAWQYRARSVLWLPFALVGPVAWILTTPAVITRSGELAYRAWPFLFLGVGVFVALALLAIAREADSIRPGSGRVVALGLAGVLLFGGVSIGENQAGRFPGPPTTAAGGATNTPDVVDAARWLLATSGPGHLVATDIGTAALFSTDGRQRILGWQAWYPFVAGDPAVIADFVRDAGVEYLVVDERITTLPPRYGSYFGAPAIPADVDPGAPFPAALLATLDDVPALMRVYDGPNIRIYRVDPDAVTPGAG
jgi:hypothetical protein